MNMLQHVSKDTMDRDFSSMTLAQTGYLPANPVRNSLHEPATGTPISSLLIPPGVIPTPIRALYVQHRVIGLYSPVARSGKSTFASMLIEEAEKIGVKARVVSFAEPLRKVAERALRRMGFTSDAASDFVREDKDERIPMSPRLDSGSFSGRDLLIGIGNGCREHVHPDIWVNKAVSTIAKFEMDNQLEDTLVVVDDMRKGNEFDALLRESAQTVRLVRDGVTQKSGGALEGELDGHHFDFDYTNNGSLEALRAKASVLLSHVF